MPITEEAKSILNLDRQNSNNKKGSYNLTLDLRGVGQNTELNSGNPEIDDVNPIDQDNSDRDSSSDSKPEQPNLTNPSPIVEDNEKPKRAPKPVPSDSETPIETSERGNILSVESDFAGDLENAIAAAQDGDVVKLGNKTYYTDGIVIDKDITIDGLSNTVIDGDGTLESIFYLNAGASGATIRDIEITNGSNGIFGDGAANLTLQNLEIHNIGITQTERNGVNNTGIDLTHAEGLRLLDSEIYNIGRKAVGLINTDGGLISGLSIRDINLAAEHAQSHDVAGVKFFNTNDITLRDSEFSGINGNYIWNDTANLTTIENNVLEGVGEDFLAPDFNNNVYMSGLSNEKSSNAIIKNNEGTSVGDFLAFQATEFSTETMTLEGNDFDKYELGTTDYWVNEEAEKLVALTEDPDSAGYSLFADDYAAQANIGI